MMSILDLAREIEELSGMTSRDKLHHIASAVADVRRRGVVGDVVEVGCHRGFTSCLLQALVAELWAADERPQLHVYDSFDGFPEPSSEDRFFSAPMSDIGLRGFLSASETDVRGTFARFGLPLPVIHRGRAEEIQPGGWPATIAFAYVDVDLFAGTDAALRAVHARMPDGGVIIVDDYCDRERAPNAWDGFPAVKEACDVVSASWRERFEVLEGDHGSIVGDCDGLAMARLDRRRPS